MFVAMATFSRGHVLFRLTQVYSNGKEVGSRHIAVYLNSSTRSIGFLGASPQTPWVRFADYGLAVVFPARLTRYGSSAKRNNAFCFFFWKKKNIYQTS
jgi:hypothetical protein